MATAFRLKHRLTEVLPKCSCGCMYFDSREIAWLTRTCNFRGQGSANFVDTTFLPTSVQPPPTDHTALTEPKSEGGTPLFEVNARFAIYRVLCCEDVG